MENQINSSNRLSLNEKNKERLKKGNSHWMKEFEKEKKKGKISYMLVPRI